jgi:Domain of unknown function (DUF4185)
MGTLHDGRSIAPLLVAAAVALATATPVGAGGPAAPPDDVLAVGTAQKVCQLTGEKDHQYQPPRPTVSRTDTSAGLVGTDNGYSFVFGGKLWFLFGDSMPTATFGGRANGQDDPPRTETDNDSIASAPERAPAGGTCPKLTFVPDSIGAFANPSVTTTGSQIPVPLGEDEVPLAGIGEGGHMYVLFDTDNTSSSGPRSVMGELESSGTLEFSDLYDLSDPPDALFIPTAIAQGADHYVYFWGAEGGTGYRKSALYLGRKRPAAIGKPGLDYFAGFRRNGGAKWAKDDPTAAVAVVSDSPACMGEHSLQWNPYVARWILLYNCADDSTTNPRGIWIRTADEPWGPWTPPHTLFPTTAGLCVFIHRAVTTKQPKCDDLGGPSRLTVQGGDYSPFILPTYTTGSYATAHEAPRSTFDFTMSTWNPYEVVLMTATIEGPKPPLPVTTTTICKPPPPPAANPCR